MSEKDSRACLQLSPSSGKYTTTGPMIADYPDTATFVVFASSESPENMRCGEWELATTRGSAGSGRAVVAPTARMQRCADQPTPPAETLGARVCCGLWHFDVN